MRFRLSLDALKWALSFQIGRARSYWPIIRTLVNDPRLLNRDGIRFLELSHLLSTRWLPTVMESRESALAMCSQFENVRKNCDELTFEEPGAVEAYVVLHFLDRYRRFQLTFNELARQGIMPHPSGVNILDIGTGPGPSMFAASDFYRDRLWRALPEPWNAEKHVAIDYVERSRGFRHWLHHFTEIANYWPPSAVGWAVPYHHGSTYDFGDIEFDRRMTYQDYDYDGEPVSKTYVAKTRPNLIVMSNFLTTEEQAEAFAEQIRDCARNLRNRGILLIVGARRSSPKYIPVYEIVDRAVLDGKYSRRAYWAKCERLKLENPILSYNYADEWGRQLKRFFADVRIKLSATLGGELPREVDKELEEWSKASYSHTNTWEVTVYRKIAVPRTTSRKKNRPASLR